MTIHYHGTPLTPRDMLWRMAGKHFCVSFGRPTDGDLCLRIGQSCMLDNGAYSFHTLGKPMDWAKYYEWLEPRLVHPHWAVIPDVIDGSLEENVELIKQWPYDKDVSAVVWHMHEPLDHLVRLTDMGFAKICLGSSGSFWKVGSDDWCERADEAFDALAKRGRLPWVHMMRGMSMAGKRWPFASVDSTNVARNWNSSNTCPESMARVIDSVQCPPKWAGIKKIRQMKMEFVS